jgi:WD40 repeat protein
MRVLTAHKKPITCLAFSRDGAHLAEAAHGGAVRVWDVAAGTVTRTLDVSSGMFPNQVKLLFGPDGTHLVAANDRVMLYDLKSGEPAKMPGQSSSFNGLHLSPDRTELIADGDKLFRWNLSNRTRLPDFKFPAARGAAMFTWPSAAYSPNGEMVAISRRTWTQGDGNTNTAFVIDRTTGKSLAAFDSAGNDTKRLAFSPDGALLAAASGPVLRVYDIAEREEVAALKVGKLHFMAATFSPDGRYLMAVSKDRTTRLWRVDHWSEPKTLEWDIGKLLDLAFSPDGTTAAVAGDLGRIALFDVD